MKKLWVISGAVLLQLFLIGCGGTSNSVNTDGTCTEQFVNDYNAVYDAAEAATKWSSVTGSKTDLSSVKAQCDTFTSHHQMSVTCEATVIRGDGSSSDSQLQSATVWNACTQVNNIIQDQNKPTVASCSQDFIDRFNGIDAAITGMAGRYSEARWNDFKKQCKDFEGLYEQAYVCQGAVDQGGVSIKSENKASVIYGYCNPSSSIDDSGDDSGDTSNGTSKNTPKKSSKTDQNSKK